MEPDGWLGVELRHLAALQAVAREGSFSAAATRLGYTQSAVSQQIATLERIVGERLIERPGGPRRVSMTEAGALLVRHAEGIVARLQAARADLAALASGEAGTLRVGTFQSVGARVLPAAIRRFSAAWPRVAVELTEAEDADLLVGLERGDLDLAFADARIGVDAFASLELLRDPYVLLVPADSQLASRGETPALEELGQLSLISYRRCTSTLRFEEELRERGVTLPVVFRSDDNATVQALVAAGMGSALVPRLAVEASDRGVRMLPVGGDVPPRVIVIAWHRERYRSPASRAFVETAAQVCAELEASSRASAAQSGGPPGTQRTSPPASRLAPRARMKSRSDSRLR
jgi:molybdate transport repressor ModE-like protein